MKRFFMGNRLALFAGLIVLLLALLTGCSGPSDPEELFALPQPPEGYRNLNQRIEEVLREIGGESIAPTSGSNTQTVQLQDLDGDGTQDSAVAFFRVTGDEKPLKIYIFRRQGEDNYELDTVIEEVGTAINSVAYENVGGSLDKEIIVSWQLSGTNHTLGVYSQDDLEGIELLWVGSYSRFRVADLDGDGERELVVLTRSNDEETFDRADYYDYDGAALALKSTAPLSSGISEITSVRGGLLVGGTPAVFVTSSFEREEGKGQVVDVLACRDGELANVTLKSGMTFSEDTQRYYTAVSGSDINADGIMELPKPQPLPTVSGDAAWTLGWQQFDLEGGVETVFTTYHNVTDGWYLILPDEWVGKITVSRKDSTSADERAVVFSRWNGEGEDPTPFMTLYKFTGTNRVRRASIGNRQTLVSDSNAIYAYEITADLWSRTPDTEELRERFHKIMVEWSTDN